MATVSAQQVLFDVGKRLSESRPNKDYLVKLLKRAEESLSSLNQSRSLKSVLEPINNSLVQHYLLQHKDKDVKLLVVVCLTEILRIVAPDPPYEDELLKVVFDLIISIFVELADSASPYFPKRVKILETVAALRCCVTLLDIGCDDLILKMFNIFFSVVRDEHPQSVFQCFLSIMTPILEEEVSQPLLDVILRNLLLEEKSASFRLAVAIIENCAEKLEPIVRSFLLASILNHDAVGSELKEFYHDIIFKIFQSAPQMLLAVIPNLIQELLNDNVDVRIKATKLVGRLFALSGRHVAHEYRPLFLEFLKRFTDKFVEVRLCAVECAKSCFKVNSSGREAVEVLTALEGRLLDFEDKVRTQAVNVICDLAIHDPKCIPSELILQAMGRLRDKKVSVRKNAMVKLMELYREYCTKCFDGLITHCDHFEQIPSRILSLCYDKDFKEFRPQSMEILLAEDLFPASLSVEEKTVHWISTFSFFTLPQIKAFESILSQKQRLQTEMHRYLARRKKEKSMQEKFSEVYQWNLASFKKMSKSFVEPSKAEESFQKLHQMKDNSIFKALLQLLDEGTSSQTAQTIRGTLLKRIGTKHPEYEFLKLLSAKCSYNIFTAEHVNFILLNYHSGMNSDNQASPKSGIDLLLTIVNFFPSLLRGLEESLMRLLLQEGGPLKEKLLQMLAKAGSHISSIFSAIYPSLEQLCLNGTRLQSKYSISAIAALTEDSLQLAFSNLYKRLVDSLLGGRNVPAVLQSLGCIAQHSASLFESREGEITQYIIEHIFQDTNSSQQKMFDDGYPECSANCKLKIYALKTLLKYFLPHEGTQVRQRVREFFNILPKLLQEGDISDVMLSSENDKAHMRLAAAKSVLRLARRWDMHISPMIFRLVIMRAQDHSSFVRRFFLDKVHSLLKEHAVPIRYACALTLAASDCLRDVRDDSVKYLAAFVEEYRRDAQILQTSTNKNLEGAEMVNYPEYIIVFLIHVLAHDPNFPSETCKDEDVYAGFCSPLFVLLQALMTPNLADKRKNDVNENLSYILGIFRVIKKAEDAVDKQMTSKLHILSEIGMRITKVLGSDFLSSSHSPERVLLPSSLYKAAADAKHEKASGHGDNESVTGLHGCSNDGSLIEKVIHVFESLISQPSIPRMKRPKKSQEDPIYSDGTKQYTNNLSSLRQSNTSMNKTEEAHSYRHGKVHIETSRGQLNTRLKKKNPLSPTDSLSEALKDSNNSIGDKTSQPSFLSKMGNGYLDMETASSTAGANKEGKKKRLRPPASGNMASKSEVSVDDNVDAIARRTRSRKN